MENILYPAIVLINSNTVVVSVPSKGKSITISANHKKYAEIKNVAERVLAKKGINDIQLDYLNSLVDVTQGLSEWSDNKLVVDGNTVTYNGKPVPSELEHHLLNLYESGDKTSFEGWSNFMANIEKAANNGVYENLIPFLIHNDIVVNKRGNILAYKVVRNDYLDIHSRSINYAVGQTPTLPRHLVDADPNRTCSSGLHVCAYSYLNSFGSQGNPVMLVEVSIEDMVSVPVDYNGAKLRACKMHVLAELGKLHVNLSTDKVPDLTPYINL